MFAQWLPAFSIPRWRMCLTTVYSSTENIGWELRRTSDSGKTWTLAGRKAGPTKKKAQEWEEMPALHPKIFRTPGSPSALARHGERIR